jgi:hypothetical protein
MASVKLTLRVPTLGKKRGDEIEVATQEEADRLIANGTARPAKAKAAQSDKG